MATPRRDKSEAEPTTTLLIKDDAKDFARKYLLADNDAQTDNGKDDDDNAEHQVRPTRLGIGAKFLPHSKAVGGFSDAVSEKIAKRITKGRRSDDANDGSTRIDGSATSGPRFNLGSNINSGAVKKLHPGGKHNQSTVPNNRNKTKNAARGNGAGNGKDNEDDDDGESRSRIIQKRPFQLQKQPQPQPPAKAQDEVKVALVNQDPTQQNPKSAFPENLVDDGFIPLKTSTNDELAPQNKSDFQSPNHLEGLSLHRKKGISSAVENEPKRPKREESKQGQDTLQETIQKTRRRTKTRSRMKNLRKDNRKQDEKPAHIQGEIIQPKTNKTKVIFKDKELREKAKRASFNNQTRDSAPPSGVTMTSTESNSNKEKKVSLVPNAKGNKASSSITAAPTHPSLPDQPAPKKTETPEVKARKQTLKKKVASTE